MHSSGQTEATGVNRQGANQSRRGRRKLQQTERSPGIIREGEEFVGDQLLLVRLGHFERSAVAPPLRSHSDDWQGREVHLTWKRSPTDLRKVQETPSHRSFRPSRPQGHSGHLPALQCAASKQWLRKRVPGDPAGDSTG